MLYHGIISIILYLVKPRHAPDGSVLCLQVHQQHGSVVPRGVHPVFTLRAGEALRRYRVRDLRAGSEQARHWRPVTSRPVPHPISNAREEDGGDVLQRDAMLQQRQNQSWLHASV